MNRDDWMPLFTRALTRLHGWESRWPETRLPAPTAADRQALDELSERLGDCYPFFHPGYAGQMLKPPHPVAWLAYSLTAAQNPNNHARDGGPATAELELEVVASLAEMVGFGTEHLGHLCSGGTVANLEALWVARELHGPRAIAVSRQAHYTHERAARILGMSIAPVDCDAQGRMEPEALERVLATGEVGTVIATLGTTGLGAVDPLHEIAPLARSAGARIHVDAAYGGFFALLARRDPPLVEPQPFAALAGVDSVVVDPHKHGLQPYGCGAVIFADPEVAAIYGHDSPYTYYSDPRRHLGEIALECSRPGASAAALWATLRAIPLSAEGGLGDHLAAGRRAALRWAAAIDASSELRLWSQPDTDILVFAPSRPSVRETSAACEEIYQRGMNRQRPLYLAKLRVAPAEAVQRWGLEGGEEDELTLLRSVVMKPAQEETWPSLHARLLELAR